MCLCLHGHRLMRRCCIDIKVVCADFRLRRHDDFISGYSYICDLLAVRLIVDLPVPLLSALRRACNFSLYRPSSPI